LASLSRRVTKNKAPVQWQPRDSSMTVEVIKGNSVNKEKVGY